MTKPTKTSHFRQRMALVLAPLLIVCCAHGQTLTPSACSQPQNVAAAVQTSRAAPQHNVLTAIDGVTAMLLLAAVYLGYRLTALNLAVAHAVREYNAAAKRMRELRTGARSPADWRSLAVAPRAQVILIQVA